MPAFQVSKNLEGELKYSMKTCCICKRELNEGCFKSNKAKKDGLQSQCVDCQKDYRRKHYLKNKRKYIDKAAERKEEFRRWWIDFKSQYVCECGESHPACIHFHHPNDDKEDNVSTLAAHGSKRRLLAEVKKCRAMCANCHAKLHWQR